MLKLSLTFISSLFFHSLPWLRLHWIPKTWSVCEPGNLGEIKLFTRILQIQPDLLAAVAVKHHDLVEANMEEGAGDEQGFLGSSSVEPFGGKVNAVCHLLGSRNCSALN